MDKDKPYLQEIMPSLKQLAQLPLKLITGCITALAIALSWWGSFCFKEYQLGRLTYFECPGYLIPSQSFTLTYFITNTVLVAVLVVIYLIPITLLLINMTKEVKNSETVKSKVKVTVITLLVLFLYFVLFACSFIIYYSSRLSLGASSSLLNIILFCLKKWDLWFNIFIVFTCFIAAYGLSIVTLEISTKRHVRRILMVIVTILFFSTFMPLNQGYSDAKKQTEFSVITLNAQQYAVLYEHDNVAVLNLCTTGYYIAEDPQNPQAGTQYTINSDIKGIQTIVSNGDGNSYALVKKGNQYAVIPVLNDQGEPVAIDLIEDYEKLPQHTTLDPDEDNYTFVDNNKLYSQIILHSGRNIVMDITGENIQTNRYDNITVEQTDSAMPSIDFMDEAAYYDN